MRGKLIGIAVAAFAGAACASSGGSYEMSEKVSTRLAEFERTGDYQTCLGLRRINQINPLDERNFLVRVGVNQYYLNKVSGNCNGADRSFNRIQYTTSISQLCRNEIISVVDNTSGFFVGSCSLGDFERLEKKPDDAEAEQDES
ncbi:MAG: hypothetical protein GXP06_01450 [Alphaproteobacteria bacterium]|nr:hypothetical protein [Alphaproteobacteria bacterium]